MPNPDTLTVTAASEWRKPAEGFVVSLPSGKVAKVRRSLDILEMMKSGKIPNVLKGVVAEAIKDKDPSKINIEDLDPDVIGDLFSMVDQIVLGMMLEPRVLPNPPQKEDEAEWEYKYRLESEPAPEGYIWLQDVDVEDRMFLFGVAQGGTTDVTKFREEQATTLGTLSNVEAVPDPPVKPARASKRK